MRANYLGSSPLTIMVGCVCGHPQSVDRHRRPAKFIFRCDNCRSLIAYPSLVVVVWRAEWMENHDFTPEEMREFGDVFAELDRAKAQLEAVAKTLEGRGYRDRAHKVRGLTQAVDAQKYLLAQDWRDRKAAA